MNKGHSNFPTWKIALTDSIVVLSTTFGVQYAWPTSGKTVLSAVGLSGKVTPTYTIISLLICALWLVSLWQIGSRKSSLLGHGTEEYSKVARATLLSFTVVALLSYLLKAQIARGYLLLAFPVGLLLLLLSRWLWRKWLLRCRRRGEYCKTAVVLGSPKSADEVCERLSLNEEVGLRACGAFLNDHSIPLSHSQQLNLARSGVPIWGGLQDLIPVIRERRIDCVIVASTEKLDPLDVRQLGWQLLPSKEQLYLAANVLDIAGPRLSIKPVSGLPLIEVDQPQFEGLNRLLKRWIDLIFGTLALIITSPLFIFAAAHIKWFDGQSVFFTQERIGKSGHPFKMYKFRTMSTDATQTQQQLDLNEHDLAGNTVLFKLKDDPRVTKPGKWLRRFSVDELPQLFNVLRGNMSLVGPRPPLSSEVDKYDDYVRSRFIVKPGITGLWQVSGRSELSWNESVRADLGYVQNWTIMLDFAILWRTVKAVLTGKGAY